MRGLKSGGREFEKALQDALPIFLVEEGVDELVHIAREAGALGAKLTGGGGGGSIVALCPDDGGTVAEALESYGFTTLGSEWLDNQGHLAP